jgi:hypothetical protein
VYDEARVGERATDQSSRLHRRRLHSSTTLHYSTGPLSVL